MKIQIFKNRTVYPSILNAGNILENQATTIEFTVPEELKEYSKYIEIEDCENKCIDKIENNVYVVRRNITKHKEIKAQIVFKKLEDDIVFKTDKFTLLFGESVNAEKEIEEEKHGILDEIELDLQKSKENITNIEEKQEEQSTEILELQKQITDVENKITDIQKEQLTQDENIEELQQENALLKQQIPTGKVCDEYITLNDSSNMPFDEFKITGNSIQDGTPTTEEPVEIKNVTGSANITICNKNLLSNNFEKYNVTDGIYGYYKLPFVDKLLRLSIKDKNTSIDITGIYFGFTTNGSNANAGSKWLIESGNLKSMTGNINNQLNGYVQYISFYPKNKETLNKIFQRYYIQVELDEVTDYIEHKSQVFTFPLLEGQKLCRKNEKEYDYLGEEGIVNILEQIDDTGTKTIENSFITREVPLITPYTLEQQEAYNQIKKASSYKNITHIFSTNETSPIFEINYKKDQETINKAIKNRLTAIEEILSTTATSAMLLENMQTDLESEV